MRNASVVLGVGNSVLRNRVYTALLLAGLTAVTIFWAPLWLFAVMFAIAASLGAYEWAAFAGWGTFWHRAGYVAGLVLCILLSTTQREYWAQFIGILCVVWTFGFASIALHPRFSNVFKTKWLLVVLGWSLLLGAWICLVSLFEIDNGRLWLFWLFLLTTATDVGAFFWGRSFGRTALAATISPGKTREGALGGVTLALLICGPALYLGGVLTIYETIGFTLFMSVVSILGDLFESLLKRVSGVKDSGNILPGHGGLLDRIDSIIAVLPFLVWSVA